MPPAPEWIRINREYLHNRCINRSTINFDDLKRDTKVTNQYAPLAKFLQDGLRTPLIIDGTGRAGAPTASPENSLLNHQEKGGLASLVITFDPPQRAVAMSVGRITTELEARAVLQGIRYYEPQHGTGNCAAACGQQRCDHADRCDRHFSRSVDWPH